MIVHTPLGEAGASPSRQPDKPTDGAQEMAVLIEKWNDTGRLMGDPFIAFCGYRSISTPTPYDFSGNTRNEI
jgi:hypothetical protein